MRINLKSTLILAGLIFGMSASSMAASSMAQMPAAKQTSLTRSGVVKEVLQANSYTYLNMLENGKTFWIAVPKREAKPGQTLYFSQGMEMTNFKSKDLDRTFDSILFVGGISDSQQELGSRPAINNPHGSKVAEDAQEVKITPLKGGTTIAQLYANTKKFGGKTITMKGKVTKFNMGILGKNWIHIQDGTSSGSNHDITITTDDVVHVGDVVIFKGQITLNKDFGMGYAYDVIMENAKKM